MALSRGKVGVSSTINLVLCCISFLLGISLGPLTTRTNIAHKGDRVVSTENVARNLQSHNYVEELMYKYKSDKSRDDHSYVKFYNMIFANVRLSIKNMTEIGIAAGQSLQAWHRYFPNSEIHGFDVKWYGEGIVKDNLQHLKRVHAHIANILDDKVTMSLLGFMPESMDVIIDDGPHTVDSQEIFLRKLFPCLKPGGYYIIEDIGITGGGNGVTAFHEDPTKLHQGTRDILLGHDTIWVDTAIGHRAWKEWLKRVGHAWAANTTHHNSHMVVIQKRKDHLREPYQMHYKDGAMNPRSIVLEGGTEW